MSKGQITIYDSTDSTYLLLINPAKTSYVYNKDGSIVNKGDTLGVFSFTLYEDGVDITNKLGLDVKWSTPLAATMVTGSSTAKTFEPGLVSEFNIAKSNNCIDLRVIYNGVTLKGNQPIAITKVSEDGNDGVNARFVWVSANSNVVKYDKDGKNPDPSDTIITANTQNLNTRNVKWFETKSDGSTIKELTIEDGIEFIGGELVQNPKIKFTPNAKIWSGKNILYVKVLVDGMEDSTSISKLKDGADGQTGRSYRNRGTWESAEVYGNDPKYVDTVRYEGSLYECLKQTNPGIKPTDERYWFLLVQKGDAGPALDWIQDWDGKKVTIGGSSIVAPKIFLGQNAAQEGEAPILSGVAIGTDVNGSYDSTIGIVGYNNNIPNFQMETNGAVWFGRDPKRRLTIKDDGSLLTPDITADTIKGGTLKIGGALKDITGNEGLKNTNGKILVFDSNKDVDNVNEDQAIVAIDTDGITMKKGKIKGNKTLIDVTDGDFFVGEFKSDGVTPDSSKAYLHYTNNNGTGKLVVNASEINFTSSDGGGGIMDKFDKFEEQFQDLANDMYVTPAEKKQLSAQLIEINKEYEAVCAQALQVLNAQHESLVAYEGVYKTLISYIGDLLVNRDEKTEIDRSAFITNFNNYYLQRGLVNKAITNAHIEGDKISQDLVNDIANDLIITPAEKNILAREYAVINGEFKSTLAHAQSVGIEKTDLAYTNYEAGYNAIKSYLYDGSSGILVPPKNEQNTILTDANILKNLYATYYNNKAVLLDRISNSIENRTSTSIAEETEKLQNQLNNMATDSVISPVEKSALRKQLVEITTEKENVIEQIKQGIYNGSVTDTNNDNEVKALKGKYDELKNYLINDVKIEIEPSNATNITTTTFNLKFNNYFNSRDAVIRKITTNHKTEIDKSKTEISNIGSDMKVTPSEKLVLNKKFKQEIEKEKPQLIAQANKYGVSTTNYINKYNELNSYLYITPGVLTDLTSTYAFTSSTEVGNYNNKFSNYYDEKAKLMTEIVNGTWTKADGISRELTAAADAADKKGQDALNTIKNILDDDVVTDDEKITLRSQITQIETEFLTLHAEASKFFIGVIPPNTLIGTWKETGAEVRTGLESAEFWNQNRDDINITYEHMGRINPAYQELIDDFKLKFNGNGGNIKGLKKYVLDICNTEGPVTVPRNDINTQYSNYYTSQKTLLTAMSTVEHDIKSSFKQTSDGIDMIVGSYNKIDGKWNANSLLTGINLSPGKAQIYASKINIKGEVTLETYTEGLGNGKTVINGGSIQTGTITLGGTGVSKPNLQIKNSSDTIVTKMDLSGIATTGNFVIGNTDPNVAQNGDYKLRFSGKNLDVNLNRASITAASSITLDSTGTFNVVSGSSIKVSGGSIKLESRGVINIESGSALNIKTGTSINIENGGSFSIVSGGSFSLNAENVSIQNSSFRLGPASNPLLNFTGNSLTLGADVKLSWGNLPGGVASSGDIPDDTYITNITKNTITTEYINGKKITAASVSASGITAGTITGCDFVQSSSDSFYADTQIRGGRVQFVRGSECYGVLCGGDSDRKLWVQGINALKLDCTSGHISITPKSNFSDGRLYLYGQVVIMGGASNLVDKNGKPIGGGSAYFG